MTDPVLEDWNHPLADVDRAIRRVNTGELLDRRRVRGRDLNDWHGQLRDWRDLGEHSEALRLLLEIIAAVETLEQYDSREPRYEWYLWAAREYEALGLVDAAVAVLERWGSFWPTERECWPSHRATVASRLRRLRRL